MIHDLSCWIRVCRKWESLCKLQHWDMVWKRTHQTLIETSSIRFAHTLHRGRESDRIRESANRFIEQMQHASARSCLELGLLPPERPPWGNTVREVEDALFRTLQFCSFQVTSARIELQYMRGAIPVLESATVLFSLLHLVVGLRVFSVYPSPRPLSALSNMLFAISLSWCLYLGAYTIYRIRLTGIKGIPAEAVQLWNFPPQRKGKRGVLAQLLNDKIMIGATLWTLSLVVSVFVFQVQSKEEYLEEDGNIPSKILISFFIPPTMAATIVAWSRAGKRMGLLAGLSAFVLISLTAAVPAILFCSLGLWALAQLIRINCSSQKLVGFTFVSRFIGNMVMASVTLTVLKWFTHPRWVLHYLIMTLSYVSAWVCFFFQSLRVIVSKQNKTKQNKRKLKTGCSSSIHSTFNTV